MPARASVAAAFLSAFALFPHGSVAADSPIVITQTKAAAGGVTPGDTAGFPVTISQPGSYVLGSHLLPPSNKNGILVTADFVDIDMNGFRLYGGNVAGYGVYVQGKSFGKIHDGTIANFKYDGIRILSPGNAWTVEKMQIVRNSSGIYADPSLYMRILSNSVLLNFNHGIYCGNSCHVEGNTSSDNGHIGIRALTGTVLGNTVYSNGFFGILGANTGFGNNTLVGNRANGPAGAPQVSGVVALHPNICLPTPC